MLLPEDEVDRSSPVPLHNQLYHLIKEEFTTQFRPGELLPPEVDLADRFQVGRGTVRNALKTLTNEGLIERIAGRGSFLREDAYVRLRRYRVAVVLSREEAWGRPLEVLNGVFGAQSASNVALELWDGEVFGPEAEAGFDGVLLFPAAAFLGDRLTKPAVTLNLEPDLVQGYGLVAADLVGRGCARPAFVGNPDGGRLAGVNGALTALGKAPVGPEAVVAGPDSPAEAARVCGLWLDQGGAADAFVCSSDPAAEGVLAALAERKSQARVYGFDGHRHPGRGASGLVTVAFDWSQTGAQGVQELRALLDGRTRPPRVLPRGRLVGGGPLLPASGPA